MDKERYNNTGELEDDGVTIGLTELIDVPTLQMIQDAFSNLTGMAALTADKCGVAVTNGSAFTDFCMEYIRKSPLGKKRCEECDRYGAVKTQETGRSTAYFCHAHLMDFAAPITLNGHMIGSFIGGQAITQEPDEDTIRALAAELEVDPEGLCEASRRVKVCSQETIEKSAHFLEEIAGFLSEMAYGSYLARKAGEDIKRAASMKTDFLANMSHEIRTPMNAVIGMAEMALREDLDETATEYIEQIRSSGTTLLTIINDILDYSKIESGKMEIIPESYEPVSVVNDIANVAFDLIPRENQVEVIIDIDPRLPGSLSGDDLRIKQVIKNLVTNAVKFTKKGSIKLSVSGERVSENDYMIRYSVKDTGTGIKEEDIKNLFTSFQQLDSKRNRSTEGTGLGLAISRNLASIMGGGLEVESVYGEGSDFSLVIPQKVSGAVAPLVVYNRDRIRAYGLFGNGYVARQFKKDGEMLGVRHRILVDKYELLDMEPDENTFVFIDKKYMDDEIDEYIEDYPELTVIVVLDQDAKDDETKKRSNVFTIRKPLYSLNIGHIYNRENSNIVETRAAVQGEFDFVIPDARILVVDDNAINITVAEGLIEPLHANIDRALSGREAIDKIEANGGYDLVLMDHLMPGMDGVETTKLIREKFPQYKDMPVIALTANAFSEVKDIFMACGMNDYLAKPIEIRILKQKLKQYLPAEYIKRAEALPEEQKVKKISLPKKVAGSLLIGDLDVTAAIGLLGNEKLFFKVLKDYYDVIEKKAAAIKAFYDAQDWSSYTIEVHALKSASRQIGANELADIAAALEKAGHEGDYSRIQEDTDYMLDKYRSYITVLAPHFPEEEKVDEASKPPITMDVLVSVLDSMCEALDELDMDQVAELLEKLRGYGFNESGLGCLDQIKEASDNFDVEAGAEAIEKLRALVAQE